MMMNQRLKSKKVNNKSRPIPRLPSGHSTKSGDDERGISALDLQPVQEETKADLAEDSRRLEDATHIDKSEIERFIEISKYFSSPIRKTASYICEHRIVSYPNPFRIQYRRGGVTAHHIKFTNLTLEPVYIKLFKLVPDLEQLKFINLASSRCKRIPPGLSFNLGFVFDDVNEVSTTKAKIIFVASRKTTTPCYQICEIDLEIEALKIKQVTH